MQGRHRVRDLAAADGSSQTAPQEHSQRRCQEGSQLQAVPRQLCAHLREGGAILENPWGTVAWWGGRDEGGGGGLLRLLVQL